MDPGKGVKRGCPKLYKSKTQKSKTKQLSNSTVAYNNTRKRLPIELIDEVFQTTIHWGELEKENGYGLRTYVTDGFFHAPPADRILQ
jgi:hypothetical protein